MRIRMRIRRGQRAEVGGQRSVGGSRWSVREEEKWIDMTINIV
jgi:hypothetical protein